MLEIEKFHKQEYGVLPEITVIHGGSFHILGELCDFLNLPTFLAKSSFISGLILAFTSLKVILN